MFPLGEMPVWCWSRILFAGFSLCSKTQWSLRAIRTVLLCSTNLLCNPKWAVVFQVKSHSRVKKKMESSVLLLLYWRKIMQGIWFQWGQLFRTGFLTRAYFIIPFYCLRIQERLYYGTVSVAFSFGTIWCVRGPSE